MFTYQVVIMVVLCFLCLDKASFWGAFTVLMAFCLYGLLVIPSPDMYYYSLSSLLNFIVGIVLQRNYRVAAICSFSLPVVNVFGFWLYEAGYDSVIYDNICAIILLIQLSSLLPKGLLNGIRRNDQYPMAKFGFFNGN